MNFIMLIQSREDQGHISIVISFLFFSIFIFAQTFSLVNVYNKTIVSQKNYIVNLRIVKKN